MRIDSANTDPFEAILRRLPRKLLIAYVIGMGSIAISGACMTLIVDVRCMVDAWGQKQPMHTSNAATEPSRLRRGLQRP